MGVEQRKEFVWYVSSLLKRVQLYKETVELKNRLSELSGIIFTYGLTPEVMRELVLERNWSMPSELAVIVYEGLAARYKLKHKDKTPFSEKEKMNLKSLALLEQYGGDPHKAVQEFRSKNWVNALSEYRPVGLIDWPLELRDFVHLCIAAALQIHRSHLEMLAARRLEERELLLQARAEGSICVASSAIEVFTFKEYFRLNKLLKYVGQAVMTASANFIDERYIQMLEKEFQQMQTTQQVFSNTTLTMKFFEDQYRQWFHRVEIAQVLINKTAAEGQKILS